MTIASALTILILLLATPAAIVGMERLGAQARRASQIRGGQQLGPVVHAQSFAERFRYHLLRTLLIVAPVALTLAILRSGEGS